MNSRALENVLIAHGHRLTEPRQRLIAILSQWPSRFSAGELVKAARKAEPPIGRATVFRTLGLLLELGIVERVRGADDSEGYVVARRGDHHHHLVCSSCGRVEDLPLCPVEGRLKELAAERRFQVQGHNLEVYGLCEGCVKADEK